MNWQESPPANVPEADLTGGISADLDHAGLSLAELGIDRAYLSSDLFATALGLELQPDDSGQAGQPCRTVR